MALERGDRRAGGVGSRRKRWREGKGEGAEEWGGGKGWREDA